MQTIKIIDLLIMLSNKEEVPRKFTYKGYLWEYDINLKMWFYYFGEGKNHRFDRLFYLNECLNDEVVIIGEDKDIESIETYKNYLEKANEKYDSGYLLDVYLQGMSQRLIELIDIVNDLKKEGK